MLSSFFLFPFFPPYHRLQYTNTMSLHAHFQEALQFQDPPSGHARGTESPHTSGAIPFSRPVSPGIMHDQLAVVGLGAIGHWAAVNLARKLDEEGKVSFWDWRFGLCGADVCWLAVVDCLEPRCGGCGAVQGVGG